MLIASRLQIRSPAACFWTSSNWICYLNVLFGYGSMVYRCPPITYIVCLDQEAIAAGGSDTSGHVLNCRVVHFRVLLLGNLPDMKL